MNDLRCKSLDEELQFFVQFYYEGLLNVFEKDGNEYLLIEILLTSIQKNVL